MTIRNRSSQPFSILSSLAQAAMYVPALLVAGVLILASAAQAANVTWDITPGTVGTGNNTVTGGNGAWNTTNGNWTIDGGTNNIAWTNSNNDTAVFGGTAGTVTLGEAITVGGLTFNTANYTVTGNTLTFGVAGIISNAVAATIASALAGTGPITKDGAGNLTLNGATTYTNGTTINGGILTVNATSKGAIDNGPLTLSGGGRLTVSGANISSASQVSVESGGGLVAVSGNNNFTTSGKLTGSGTLTLVDPGGAGGKTFNFNSTSNDFTGGLILNGSAGLALNINSLADSANNIAFTAGTGSTPFNYGSSAPVPLALDSRAIEINSAGALTATLQNNNTSNAVTITTALVPTGAGAKTLALGAVAGPINLFAGTISDGTGGGTVAVSKTGAGVWTLSGTNTYSRATTVSAGKLVGLVGGSCSNSAVTVSAGTLGISVADTNMNWICSALNHTAASSLEFAFGGNTPSTTVAPLQVNGNVLFAVAPSVSCAGSSLPEGTYPLIRWTGTFSGVAPSSLTLPSGTGILVFDAATKTLWLSISASGSSKQPLTWKGPSGSTWVANGVVYTNWQDATTPTPVNTNYQETTVSGITVGDNVVFGNTGAGTVAVDTTVSPASMLVNSTANYTFSGLGSIAGGGGLTKTGSGSLTLSTANSYAGGTLLSAGTLIIDNDNALGTGPLVLSGGTIRNIDATDRTIDNTVVLNGITTIGGTGNINFTNAGTGTVVAASTLTVTNNINATFATAFSGAGSINKAGPGTMTLMGTNTYSGTTTVSNGTLVVNGGQITNNAVVTIGNGTHLNTMIVTNANIWSGGMNIGSLASSNTVSVLTNSVWNLNNNAIAIGYNGGTLYGNSLTVNGGVLTNVSTIGVGHLPTGGADIRYNSLVITNGGRVFANGAVSVANVTYSISGKYLAFNSLIVANGGQLSSVGGDIGGNSSWSVGVSNLIQIVGGGSGGMTSTWDLRGGNFVFSQPDTARGDIAYNTVTIDGAGVIGEAVMTNVGAVTLSGTANSIVLTNGARWFSANTVTIGSGGAKSNTVTIAGGVADSIWNAGGTAFLVGSGCSTNKLLIDAGGVLTNVNSLTIGLNSAIRNQMVVTNGGQVVVSAGNLAVGRPTVGGNSANNNALVIASGGVVNVAAGRLAVGMNGGYVTTCNSNTATISSGGQLFTRADNYVGADIPSYAVTALGNSVTVGGSLNDTNATWDLGGYKLYIGYSQNGATLVTNNSVSVNNGGVMTNVSSLVVKATNSLSLGAGGQIYAGAVTNSGTLAVSLDNEMPGSSRLNVTGNLNLNNTRLDVRASGTVIGTHVIATYGTLTGAFAVTNGLPDNCNLHMNYLGQKQIVIVGFASGTILMVE